MSRSKGAGGLADLIAKQGGERIRFFLLRTHYRSTVLFGEEAIAEAAVGLESFYRLFKRFERVTGASFYKLEIVDRAQGSTRFTANFSPQATALLDAARQTRERFLAAMDDDFNTGSAIAELFELARTINKYIDDHKLETEGGKDTYLRTALVESLSVLRELSATLGLFMAPPMQAASGGDKHVAGVMQLIIELRAAARAKKDFGTADKIREALTAASITLEDRAGGTEWAAAGSAPLTPLMQLVIELRAAARAGKDFATADKIRAALTAAGITLEDRAGGTEWTT